VWVHASAGFASGLHSTPGAHVEVFPSPNTHRAVEGCAVTVTVTPPNVAEPVSGAQLEIHNHDGRFTIWSTAGLSETSGSGIVILRSTPAASVAGFTVSGVAVR